MKIRTDFVTNSSSSSFVSISIKNKTLSEIINNHKESKSFLQESYFTFKNEKIELENTFTDGSFSCPRTVNEVMPLLIEMIEDYSCDCDDGLLEDIYDQSDKIIKNMEDVVWICTQDSYGEYEYDEYNGTRFFHFGLDGSVYKEDLKHNTSIDDDENPNYEDGNDLNEKDINTNKSSEYECNDRIYHDVFGPGTIIKIEQDVLTINFDKFGIRKIGKIYKGLKKV